MISEFYLQVKRDFIIERLLSDNKSIFCSEDKRIAQIETEHKGFHSYNKNVTWWRINFYENYGLAFINPIFMLNSRL